MIYIPTSTSAVTTIPPQIDDSKKKNLYNIIIFFNLGLSSLAENFNGGITLFDDKQA